MSQPDESDASRAEAPSEASSEARRFVRFLPWLSLVVGVVSALVMNRGPRRAALVAGASIALWLTLLVVQWLGAPSESVPGRVRGRLVRVARRSSLMATQSLVQLTMFFAFPFYLHAATFDVGHAVFLGLLALLALASLWDPLTERLMTSPRSAALLPTMGSFVALTAVLPGLGLSTQQSLWVAAAVAGGGALVITLATARGEQRLALVAMGVVTALLLPCALWLGAARVIPAAPLKLVAAEIGTRREGKWVTGVAARFRAAPERLVCATAIASPTGVRDRLFHEWSKDGALRARVALEVRGGRGQGYRTQSRILLGARERGWFACNVVTAAGQRLGGTRVLVAGERARD